MNKEHMLNPAVDGRTAAPPSVLRLRSGAGSRPSTVGLGLNVDQVLLAKPGVLPFRSAGSSCVLAIQPESLAMLGPCRIWVWKMRDQQTDECVCVLLRVYLLRSSKGTLILGFPIWAHIQLVCPVSFIKFARAGDRGFESMFIFARVPLNHTHLFGSWFSLSDANASAYLTHDGVHAKGSHKMDI